MKLHFTLDNVLAGIALGTAAAIVVFEATSYGSISMLPVNVVRIFDLNAHQAVAASTANQLPNLNTVYVAVAMGLILSSWLNIPQIPERRLLEKLRVCFMRLILFALPVAAILSAALFDALSCSAMELRGLIGAMAAAFTFGFTADDLAMKIGRIARRYEFEGGFNRSTQHLCSNTEMESGARWDDKEDRG